MRMTLQDVISHESRVGRKVDIPSTTEPPKTVSGPIFLIEAEPVPAPRMTRRDKWLQPRRPRVQRYFDFRDIVRKSLGDYGVPPSISVVFHITMPESWSKKKKEAMSGQRHRQRPDIDNFIKAVLDALFENDGGVSDIVASKRWCKPGQGRIEMAFDYSHMQ